MKTIKNILGYFGIAITFVPMLATYCIMQAFNERRLRKNSIKLTDKQREFLQINSGHYHGVGRTGQIERQNLCESKGHDIVGLAGSLEHVWCRRCDKYLGRLTPKNIVLM